MSGCEKIYPERAMAATNLVYEVPSSGCFRHSAGLDRAFVTLGDTLYLNQGCRAAPNL